jgi:hypothetical protein
MNENSCLNCCKAKWKTTKLGRRHPSGDGWCTFEYEVPVIPKAFYWFRAIQSKPDGGVINRTDAIHTDCPLFEKIKPMGEKE